MRRSCWAPCRRLTCPLALLVVAVGCRSLHPLPRPPDWQRVVYEQIAVASDFRLPPQHPLLAELAAEREAIGAALGLPSTGTPIDVYLFETAAAFQAFIGRHYPDFPPRRAVFVAGDGRLVVYAHWGDRVAEDLRHEVAHGCLHAAVPKVPLWLDEGLAEYFEVPADCDGLNRPHVERLAAELSRRDWWPDLRRLEAIESVAAMTQRDYAEAWAWVHFLLQTAAPRRGRVQG